MEMARQILSVLAVFGLLGAMLWLLRGGGRVRFRGLGAGPRPKQLASLERLPLTANHALHLVRIGSREVVVATHPQGCALLVEHNGEAP